MDGDAQAESTGHAPGPSEARSARRTVRRTAPVVGVLLAALAAVVLGVVLHASLQGTDTSLAGARVELHQALQHLATTRADLHTTESTDAAVGRTLAAESDQLSSDQAVLAQTDATVFAKGFDIAAFDSCLAGVEQALNQIAVGDSGGAASALTSVGADCRQARPQS